MIRQKLVCAFTVAALLASTTASARMPFMSGATFNGNTMLGWSRTSDPGVVAYAEMPFHGARARESGPRLGVAMTAPTASRIGAFSPVLDAPRTVDLRFSGPDFRSSWALSLRSGRAVAWSTDPADVPGARDRLLGGTGSWIAVGLLTVGAVAGAFMITEDDVPPPRTTTAR